METIADDLLEGIKSVSRFIGTTEGRAFYLAEKGEITAFSNRAAVGSGRKAKFAKATRSARAAWRWPNA
jgi:hypothetical protein